MFPREKENQKRLSTVPKLEDFAKPFDEKVLSNYNLNAHYLMPRREDIPTYYPDIRRFEKLQSEWFYSGIKKEDLGSAKIGINQNLALNHLNLIQRSFDPSHEHKSEAVAWLMSKWFDLPPEKKEKPKPGTKSFDKRSENPFITHGTADHKDIVDAKYKIDIKLTSNPLIGLSLEMTNEKENRKKESKSNKKKSPKKKKKKRSSNL